MKRIALIIAFILISTPAIAQDTAPLEKAILAEIQKFFKIEQGNRVTEYNISTLAIRIQNYFKDFKEKAKPNTEPKEATP